MKTRTRRPADSTLHSRDGREEQWPAQLAYAIWLAVPALALRTAGDHQPVHPSDFQSGRKHRRPDGLSPLWTPRRGCRRARLSRSAPEDRNGK